MTVRDIIDFRDYLRTEKKEAVSTINRNLSTIRKYFKWLFDKGYIPVNPTASVKELKRQPFLSQILLNERWWIC